jgi:hypothetical protein
MWFAVKKFSTSVEVYPVISASMSLVTWFCTAKV